jgi:hypothetical protein
MRNLIFAVLLALVLTATALAYPPATIEDATQTSITIGNLDCGTTYRIQVEEWRGGAWQDAQSNTQATDACPQAPPTADFTVSPSPSNPGQQVTLDWTGTCEAAPCSFAWTDEGSDGNGGASWNLGTSGLQTFTFRNVGTKHIELTVTDSLGRSVSSPIRQHVVENAPPPPPPPARCADGVDNDGDGAVDLADPGCTGSADDDEANVLPPPPSGGFPNPASTGVPDGWTPTTTRTTNLFVTAPGAVIQDVLFANGADLKVAAPNVTVRRSKFEGGWIDNNITNQPDGTGLLLEDVSMAAPDHAGGNFQEGAISYGGYTARRVEITGRSEGFRVSSGGPVVIEDSFVRLHPPEPCGDWHGDGIQGYGGSGLTVRNVTIDMSDHTSSDDPNCYGTAPFFYRGQTEGNQPPVVVDRLMVEGMGYPFRLGIPASVTGLKIVNNSWVFGPINVLCSAMSQWEAKIVTRDANYQPTTVRDQPCNTEDIG